MRSKLLIFAVAAICLVFVSGVAVGVVGRRAFQPKKFQSVLVEELDLTPDQRHKIQQIWSEVAEHHTPVPMSEIEKADAERWQAIDELLTPEQRAQYARIQQRLSGRIGDEERAELQAQAEQLREQIRGLGDQRQTQQESLATTPMVLNYGSGNLVPGYQPPQSLGEALGKAWSDFKEGATVVLAALIRAAPWLITILLIGLAALFVRRRWFPKAKAEAAPEPAEA